VCNDDNFSEFGILSIVNLCVRLTVARCRSEE
jgi:hypothetical protein